MRGGRGLTVSGTGVECMCVLGRGKGAGGGGEAGRFHCKVGMG